MKVGVLQVWVNGEARPAEPGTTIGTLVDALGRGRKGIAAALNEEVVPRGRWDVTEVRDGDRVEILTAAQGG
ncbi:MAG: sulfur carrier protein ThiS [Actinobacteria bacterium]|nr:sulfur carrier protein ThiS [Actinomycetota bacterium]